MLQPSYSREVYADFPIRVDEAGQKVTVQAGITQRALLDYLAAYKCASAAALLRVILPTQHCACMSLVLA